MSQFGGTSVACRHPGFAVEVVSPVDTVDPGRYSGTIWHHAAPWQCGAQVHLVMADSSKLTRLTQDGHQLGLSCSNGSTPQPVFCTTMEIEDCFDNDSIDEDYYSRHLY